MKKCDQIQEQLAALALGETSDEKRREIEKHTAECSACRQELERMQKVLALAEDMKAGAVERAEWDGAEQQVLELVKELKVRPGLRQWNWKETGRYAMAAMLLIGVVLTVFYIGGKDLFFQQPVNIQPDPGITNNGSAETRQLAQAQTLFDSDDVKGLIKLLDSNLPKVQKTAAGYLGKIGDERAIESLRNHECLWTGPAEENPFTAAIEEIQIKQNE